MQILLEGGGQQKEPIAKDALELVLGVGYKQQPLGGNETYAFVIGKLTGSERQTSGELSDKPLFQLGAL